MPNWWNRVLGTAPGSPLVEAPPPPVEPARRPKTPPARLTTINLERYLKGHPRAVVDVWAPWCGPCRAFAPVFAEAAQEWGETIGFGKVHADHEPTLVARFGVRSIPSLLFFRDGALVRTEVGVIPADRLSKLLHKVFRDLP